MLTQNRLKEIKPAISESLIQPLEPEKLNKIAVPDAETVKYVSGLMNRNPYRDEQYPYGNLGKAMFLFDSLRRLAIEKRAPSTDTKLPKIAMNLANDVNYTVLYLTWLRSCKIDAEIQKQANQLLIVFNTGMEEAEKLTANTRLYKIKDQKVWLPVQLTLSDPLFVRCWYRGTSVWKAK